MAELANCPICQAIFLKEPFRDLCPSCYEKEEAVYQRVQQFLKKREPRLVTNEEILAETGGEPLQLYQFMKTGRLRIMAYPNLSYPCERCDTMIRKGRLCEACVNDLAADLKRFELDQAIYKGRGKR